MGMKFTRKQQPKVQLHLLLVSGCQSKFPEHMSIQSPVITLKMVLPGWLLCNVNNLVQNICYFFFFFKPVFQMELQDDGITLGLENSISKDIISIINNVFQAPWGGSHTCQKDEKTLECNLCQSSILCYQLACELLERLAPKEEIRLVVSKL